MDDPEVSGRRSLFQEDDEVFGRSASSEVVGSRASPRRLNEGRDDRNEDGGKNGLET